MSGIKGNPYLGSQGTESLSSTPSTNKFYAIKAVGGDIVVTATSGAQFGDDWTAVTVSSGDVIFDQFETGVTITGSGEGRGYIKIDSP